MFNHYKLQFSSDHKVQMFVSTLQYLENLLIQSEVSVLQCNWDGIQVQPGQTMSPRNLRFAPRVTLAVDPESTFTLVTIGILHKKYLYGNV